MVYVHDYNQILYNDTDDELKDIIPNWYKTDGLIIGNSPLNQNIKVTKDDRFLSNDIGYVMIDRDGYMVAWGNTFLKSEFSTKQLSINHKIISTKTEYGLLENKRFTLYHVDKKEEYDASYVNIGCTLNAFVLLNESKTIEIIGTSTDASHLRMNWLPLIQNADIQNISINDYDIVLFYESKFIVYPIGEDIITPIEMPIFDLKRFINNPIYSSVKSSDFIRKEGGIIRVVSNDYVVSVHYANQKVNLVYKSKVLPIQQPELLSNMLSNVHHVCATVNLIGFIYLNGKVTVMKFTEASDKAVTLIHLDNCVQIESTDNELYVLNNSGGILQFNHGSSEWNEIHTNKIILFPSRQAVCLAELKKTYRYVDAEDVRQKLKLRCADHSLSRKLQRYNARTQPGFNRNIQIRKIPNKKERV